MDVSELTEDSRCMLGVTLVQVVVALIGIQKALIREKAIAVLFLIIKQVMGSILAEKNLACVCACCANFIANVFLYVTELQVLQVSKCSLARY